MSQSFSIFVINLPIDKNRKNAIEKRLNDLGAEYLIVDGVYGDDKRVVNRYNEEMAIKEHGKPLTFGEKGCAMAHALVYEKILKENIEYSLILEDDILLPDNFINIVEKEINKKNKKWDWLSFDYRYVGYPFLKSWIIANVKTIKENPLFIFYALIKTPYIILLSIFEGLRNRFFNGAKRFYRPLYNAGAYVVTLSGASKMIFFTKPLRLTADQLPNVVRFKTDFNLYGYVPLIVSQNINDYETHTSRSDDSWRKLLK